MKKNLMIKSLFVAGAFLVLSACKKEECHECHYDLNGTEVELGERCGDDLEKLEASGHVVDGQVFEVHCHEH